MKRTNIYLEERQTAILDAMARSRGISRAELIRAMLDSALGGNVKADLEQDLAAIEQSFGVLDGDDWTLSREPDDRWNHLERVGGQ